MRLALRMDLPHLGDTDILSWGLPGHTGTPGEAVSGPSPPSSGAPGQVVWNEAESVRRGCPSLGL